MTKKLIWGVVVVAFVVLVTWLIMTPGKPGKLDAFASCLAENEATFYGTFWCPNCQNQKGKFGRSARLLPYIECSTPDGRGQLKVCSDAGIEAYPTWEFAGGERITGDTPLDILAEKSSCSLPE